MHTIVAPIKRDEHGAAVGNLQTGLLLLLQDHVIQIPDMSPEDGLRGEQNRQHYGPATVGVVTAFQQQSHLHAGGDVDQPTAAALNQALQPLGAFEPPTDSRLLVRGQVTDAKGAALADLVVRAFDRDMRSEELLGEVATDVQGRYEIAYKAEQFARAEKRSADLRLSVCNAAGRELASSPTHFNAGRVETIDLVIGDGVYLRPSEYEKLVEELRPLLQGVPLAELTDEDLEFLDGETGIVGLHLLYLSLAHQAISTIPVPAAAFYGLFRQELPTNVAALLILTPRILCQALERSLQANLVPAGLREQMDTIISTLHEHGARHLLEEPDATGRTNTRQLLEVAGLSPDLQADFLKTYVAHEGSAEAFWQAVRQNPAYADSIEALQRTLQLGLVTQNNAPLVQVLQTQGKVRSLRDLAALEADELKQLINKNPEALSAIAKTHESETDEQKSARVAHDLRGLANAVFPTASLVARVQKQANTGNLVIGADAMRLLANLPELELRDVHVDRYLKKQADSAFAGVIDQAMAIAQLKIVQRVLRIAPVAEHAEIFLRDGLHSARDMATQSARAFVETYSAQLGGAAQARLYYNKALETTASSALLFTTVHQSTQDNSPAAVPQPKPDPTLLPNLTSLFGSLDLCACLHCRSVYSPAAYLVDLLQFLNPKVVAGMQIPPLQILLKRRPDLAHIPLTCENTNIPLPYTDLVNEILEYFVVHNQLDANAAYTTEHITAEELSVNSQYTLTAAYVPLQEAVYPPGLPFDRPLELVRRYLEHLGSSRHEIMQTFQRGNTPDAVAIACEALGISDQERAILTGAALTPPKSLPEFYGYSNEVDWIQQLAHVPELLKRTEITYDDLSELLKSRFLNADQAITLTEQPDTDPCDVQNIIITGLNEDVLHRLYRFIRLWRKLGWPIRDLDRTMHALGATEIDDAELHKLAHIQLLHADLKLPLSQLLSLWADIDTSSEDALYDKLFQNKAVFHPVDPDFALNDTRTELQAALTSPPATITDHAPTILAALRLSADDLAILREATGLAAQDAPLTLANLSLLYRHARLAKALKLKIKEFVVLRVLLGIDPFAPAVPDQTVTFVEQARRVKQSKFSMAGLNYLYRHLFEPTQRIVPTDEELMRLAKQLHDGLRQIAADNVTTSDPTGEVTRSKLSLLWDDNTVGQLMATLDGSATYSAPLAPPLPALTFPVPGPKILYDGKAKLLRFTGAMTQNERTTLLNLSGDAAYQAAIDNLFQQPRNLVLNTKAGFLDLPEAIATLLDEPPATSEEKYVYVLARLLPYVRNMLSRSLIKQTLADALNLDSTMAEVLLEKLVLSPTHTDQLALSDILALLDSGLSAEFFSSAAQIDPVLRRIDPMIQFNWSAGSPDSALEPGPFVVRWSGKLLAPANEPFTFYVRASDGARLLVGDQLLIDQWQAQAVTEHSATIELKAGQLYDIVLQYARFGDDARIELRWSSPTTPKSIIPAGNLYPRSTYTAFIAAFNRLHKIALLVNTFKLTTAEVAYLSKHGGDFSEFDLNALPLDRDNPSATDSNASGLFMQWRRLNDFTTLRDRLPDGDVGLIDLFALAASSANVNGLSEAVTATLIEATGWDPEALTALNGPDGFNVVDGDLRNEVALLALGKALALARRLGIPVGKLFSWALMEPDVEQAQDVVNSVKAKYEDEQWLAVGKSLNHSLRDRQREALVAYLLTLPSLQAAAQQAGMTIAAVTDLLDYFLIDVEMTSCMQTSRIKQAISSVQLFVQRCLMNLEPGISPAQINAEQWEWLKNYRVWEANRKVFLYPENWIEPELRDNKSPFFRELENQLLQNDINAETVEQAFLDYLEKLDEVSRLDICGIYTQTETEEGEQTEIIHVFGRTRETPHVYYYRQQAKGVWTAWEKIPVDIEGDHLIPVVYNRRLYLFWAHFEERPDDKQDLGAPYIESHEHYKWRIEEIKAWQAAQKEYETAKALYELAKSHRATLKNVLNYDDDTIDSILEQMGLAGYTEMPPQPAQPQEPPFSSPPALSHWEISLAWSEYRYGRWSAKQTSKQFVSSPNVQHWVENTVVSVYLPQPQQHFFKAVQSTNQLSIEALRRYSYNYNTKPGLQLAHTEHRYESVGHFLLDCGSRIEANSHVGDRDFNDLNRPDHMTSFNMGFVGGNSDKFAFTAGNHEHVILQQTGDGRTLLQSQHQYWQFALTPPYQTFAYQDDLKTYFVTNKLDSPPQILRQPDKAMLKIPLEADNERAGYWKARRATAKGGQAAQRMLNAAPTSSSSTQTRRSQAASPTPLELTKSDLKASAQQVAKNYSMAAVKVSTELAANLVLKQYLRFSTYFHPFLCEFLQRLYRDGVAGLLAFETQNLDNDGILPAQNIFNQRYAPTELVHQDRPQEDVDFGSGAYALYNWELFFHIPMLVATALSKNQRFEDALKWFHFIFNPTTDQSGGVERYWITLPFRNNSHPEKEQILALLRALASDDPTDDTMRKQVQQQIAEWRDNPFNPHAIARLRLTAYQKYVVMKYIDTLINWGDQLFRRDTIESINEALLLYVLAGKILGPRPQSLPAREPAPKTYQQLRDEGLDAFSNAMIALENDLTQDDAVPEFTTYMQQLAKSNSKSQYGGKSASQGAAQLKQIAEALYFCIPQNDQLLAYWDTVGDRLFKIRHCMNIEGIVRQLPLFEPPIDPALLVRARAAGIDLTSVLNDFNAPLPAYRFSHLLQKAVEFCNEVKALGNILLNTLEKMDAEHLSNLRASHETAMLKLTKTIKELQVHEAEETLEGIRKGKVIAETRRDYYKNIEFMNDWETAGFVLTGVSAVFQAVGAILELTASSTATSVPDAYLGVAGSFGTPLVFAQFAGGIKTSAGLQSASHVMSILAGLSNTIASMSTTMGGYHRRADEWKLQEKLATQEIAQIEKQIAAADFRCQIAQRDLENLDQQIANSGTVEEFLHTKYTNEELYNWMIGQVSGVYFQTYKLAYDLSKRAERAYQFECGVTSSDFIRFGYWDSLKKGLLAGEQLSLALKRLELAYLEQNKRGYEITKHVSLLLHNPLALIALKETGQCEVFLSEDLFDADYPGHYMRRFKSVSLTIPCVVGPYTNINCTLTLLSNKTRVKSTAVEPYAEREEGDDDRFVANFAALQSIATSHAQNDSSLFELNFRDERYLPFEGAGVISRWRIDLPRDCNAFDFDSISDVILKLNYTASDGGERLKAAARDARKEAIADQENAPLARLFSARHEFPSEWHRFLNSTTAANPKPLSLDLSLERFPFQFRGKILTIGKVELFLNLKDGIKPGTDRTTYTEAYVSDAPLTITLTPPGNGGASEPKEMTGNNAFLQGIPYTAIEGLEVEVKSGDAALWSLTANMASKKDDINDLFIVCHYAVSD